MKISVVIPVLNEEKYIEQCIQSILNNTVLPMEILICDGGSIDKTKEIAKEFSLVTILDNIDKTAASGRNIGIKHASGNIIAFTDGDCYVDKNWIEQMIVNFTERSIDGLRGKIIPAAPENKYEDFWNDLAWNVLMNFGDKPHTILTKNIRHCLVTANCAYKREVLHNLNGFDAWFGNNAEDTDLSWRAIDKQLYLHYDPSVKVITHGVTTLKGIRKKSFRNGISSSKLQKRHGTKINFDPLIYKLWWVNFIGLFKRTQNSGLNLMQLTWHLFGKYYGSIKAKVVNI
ncbi:hypothetical protein AGMMS49938_08760 [Fibrobacterales bacterium]|nr:hypothetical protein AGMMS49938_08760 [Fibrobacterales bacterium]